MEGKRTVTTNYARHISGPTPQRQPMPGRTDQYENSAGGFVFGLTPWKQLERFLVLGAEGGTYYATERKLTVENAAVVAALLRENAHDTVRLIVEIGRTGRAPKHDPVLLAYAMACSPAYNPNTDDRKAAYQYLGDVVRTGSHLLQFVSLVDQLRGWGPGLRKAIGHRWFGTKRNSEIAYQALKYPNRHGWSFRDVLRSIHIPLTSAARGRRALFQYLTQPEALNLLTGKIDINFNLPKVTVFEGVFSATIDSKLTADLEPVKDIILSRELLHRAASGGGILGDHLKIDEHNVAALVRSQGLTREMLPTSWLNSPVVWEALLEKMPITAMIRNLGKMTAIGLLQPFSQHTQAVAGRLTNPEVLRGGRVHPMAILLALQTYAQGHGDKGKLTWAPNSVIVAALDKAFYLAFEAVRPAGKRILLALDISGSMDGSHIAGSSLSARQASVAMALITAATEPSTHTVAFTAGSHRSMHPGHPTGLTEFPITGRERLDQLCDAGRRLQLGGTDCALPMLYAMEQHLNVDAFVIYTDSETWAGNIHPAQALAEYRRKFVWNAKLVVVGLTATGFSIADPNDPLSLDVVGFDAAAPAAIADFLRED